ncbi:PucR family transcriptional regulator [Leucobacter chromiireducens]|uniref:PucR family transcriptional regulator n=1 Tax=Leucobacter chromiireducens subsp. chromiireducens TaxID=660067 RepID=A0ABS1SQ14_9MICO|nr:PucR family transcriptional regulator [Leucobacter chromiireducens]MBL3690271.1 PucR family transcriptional regulator [Leucobacter chromiireducens subsp. chromiireducens]
MHEIPDVTIADIARDELLPITIITLAGKDATSPVTWVHTTERADPRPHLRANELICTLGSALVHPGAAGEFVGALAASKVAGVVLGLGEVHLSTPPSLIAACEEHGLPLLAIPHDVPFRAVDEAISRRRGQIEDEARKREVAALTALTSLAREGASAQQMLASAGNALGGTLQSPEPTLGSPEVQWDGPGLPPSAEFLQQFAALLDLAQLERTRGRAEQHARLGQLIELVSRGLAHPAALAPELTARGLSETALQVSLWPAGSASTLESRWDSVLVGAFEHSVVMLSAPLEREALHALGLVCGFSATIDLPNLRRGVNEAKSAFTLSRNRGSVAGPLDLVSLDALLEQQPADALAPFIEALIAPLIDSDGEQKGDLVKTLEVFIANDRRIQETANQLFVHVNTVRHRLTRVRDLTLRDPLTFAGLADLRIALWAYDRRRLIAHRLTRPL